jgi:hypothetical protein
MTCRATVAIHHFLMIIQYYKHHDNDRWYWQLTTQSGQVLSAGGDYGTQLECLIAMLPIVEANPAATIMYRDKPGN